MKKITIFLFTALAVNSNSQNWEIAKQNDFFSDTRNAALANSVGALGGTFSAAYINPAGLAFSKMELSMSPFIKMKRNGSAMLQNISSDEKWGSGVGQVSFVLSLERLKKKELGMHRSRSQWSNLNIGFGYLRTTDFNERLVAEGFNKDNSLLDFFLTQANFGEGVMPKNLDPMGAGLAFQTMLIDTFPRQFQYDSVKYFSVIPHGGVWQSLSIDRSGFAKSLVINFAATYGQKISLGLAVMRPTIYFLEDVVYREKDTENDGIPVFNSFTYERHLKSVSQGLGLKMGAIWQANKGIRFGAAFETPVLMNMVDQNTASMASDLADRQLKAESGVVTKNYQLTSPSKATASVSFGGNFAVNIDYDYVDYRDLKVRTAPVAFDQNREVQATLKPTANLRVGLEQKINKVALRGGAALVGNPAIGNPFLRMNPNNLAANLAAFERTTLAAGFSLTDAKRKKMSLDRKGGIEYFVEGAFVYSLINNPAFALYNLPNAPVVESNGVEERIILTLGLRF